MFQSLRDGQYQILHKLGSGGMGEVYQARDTKLNRLVAIKVLHPEQTRNADLQRRFMQEAQAASGLNHPNIITIYDVISEGGADLMIMEYITGKTLHEVIPKGGLRSPQVIGYGVQIADALAAAHAAGIVHRDLKPGNIMVSDNGLVKILDFGLAKLVAPSSADDPDATMAANPLTIEGSIIGTVAYMSPEQAQGKRVDTRSDIFAFGAVLYEMATGIRAFSGEDTVSTLTAVLRDEARPMPEVAPDVPPELEQLIQRCLRKNPDDRWQSMKEVQQELLALKQGSDSGTLYRSRLVAPPPVPSSAPPPARRSPLPLIGALAALLVAAAGGGWWFFSQRGRPPAPASAASGESPAQTPAAPVPSDRTLRDDDILAMVREKVPNTLIVSQIRASKTDFDLSAQEVIRLVKGGVPEAVIEVMRDPQKKPSAAVSAAPPPVPSAVPQTTPSQPESSSSTAPNLAKTPATGAPAVTVHDATPLLLSLEGDIPPDASEGQPLRLSVASDVVVDGAIVVAKGAPASGEIYEAGKKRKLFGGKKMTYRLIGVRSVDGKQLRLRATPAAAKDAEVPSRPVPAKGSNFMGYVDGDVTVAGAPQH